MAPRGHWHRLGASMAGAPVAQGHTLGGQQSFVVQGHQHGTGVWHRHQQCMDTAVHGCQLLTGTHGVLAPAWHRRVARHRRVAWVALMCCTGTALHRCLARMRFLGASVALAAGLARSAGSGRDTHPQGGITQRQRFPLPKPRSREVPPPAPGLWEPEVGLCLGTPEVPEPPGREVRGIWRSACRRASPCPRHSCFGAATMRRCLGSSPPLG